MAKAQATPETAAEETPTGAEEAVPTPDAGTPAAAARVKLETQNDVSKPREGTKTRRVWDIADEISTANKRPALRGEVMDKCAAEGMSPGTAATQFGKWCTFHGLTKEDMKAVRDSLKPAEPEPAPAAEVGTEPAAEEPAEA